MMAAWSGLAAALTDTALRHLPAAALGGILAGWIGNRCIDQLPWDRWPWQRREPCPACGWGLRRVVSGLPLLGGWPSSQCRRCVRRRGPWSPASVELALAVVGIALAVVEPRPGPLAARLTLAALLVPLGLIDARHFILPDLITLPGTVLGIAATWVPGWPVTLTNASLSAGLAYLGMLVLARGAERYYEEEAIGQGDWKMVAMLGAWFGSPALLSVLLAASLLGSVVGLLLVRLRGGRRQRLPLGTFLALAGIAFLFI